MKKLVLFVAVGTLLFCISGCRAKKPPAPSQKEAQTSTTQEAQNSTFPHSEPLPLPPLPSNTNSNIGSAQTSSSNTNSNVGQSSSSYPRKCPTCDGEGDTEVGSTLCPDCRGKGVVLRENIGGYFWDACSTCTRGDKEFYIGRGRGTITERMKCKRCNGSGWL